MLSGDNLREKEREIREIVMKGKDRTFLEKANMCLKKGRRRNSAYTSLRESKSHKKLYTSEKVKVMKNGTHLREIDIEREERQR